MMLLIFLTTVTVHRYNTKRRRLNDRVNEFFVVHVIDYVQWSGKNKGGQKPTEQIHTH